ncbi:hypothetical protein MPSEU_000273900 [Mayamaea pseudoterrestris]|nr:hypothetical protein MPSEU_000273900 [Mayamaea pseudoterrestris]
MTKTAASFNVERNSTSDHHPHHHGRSQHRCPPSIRIICSCIKDFAPFAAAAIINFRTAADVLPIGLLQLILFNATTTSFAFGAAYLIFMSLWFPFKLLSLLITEVGVYMLTICVVFSLGRSIIRLIAFPGACSKVTSEIEGEFTKYSVRMITLACESIMEVAQAIVSSNPKSANRRANNNTLYDLPIVWSRAKSYRDRILGVYVEVLLYVYQESPLDSSKPTSVMPADLTRFGNNRLSGDVGDLSGLSPQARTDGRELMKRLQQVISLLDGLCLLARPVLEAGLGHSTKKNPLNDEAFAAASQLLVATTELRDCVQSLRPSASSTNTDEENGDEEEDLSMDTMRRKFEEQGSFKDMVQNGISSVLSMIDPPPHHSIFGLDVQRGCMMSRYRGCRQFWVKRPKGGMIDVLHFPGILGNGLDATGNKSRAVLYCNPNAGLIEVSAGMSLVGGNLPSASADSSPDGSWVDYYMSMGLDVYVFNYAGYGRSYGTTTCSNMSSENAYHPGLFARLARIFRSTFLAFTPTPHSLRSDATFVAQHLINDEGVNALIIHGESIGGMAAAGAGNVLSHALNTQHKLALLVCDRTFCNLEAVAQRLVGGWSGYAIRCLAPFWSTDVAGDFVAAACPKIVANDAADCIINDAPSLKSGIALWKELLRSNRTTRGIGWFTEDPLQYRMAEFENCCVNESKYMAGQSLFGVRSPVWPADKHVSMEEAFHFAACCKRIGKVAKDYRVATHNTEEAIEFSQALEAISSSQPLVCGAWKVVACCDGLTGAPLGVSVKQGYDSTVAWLCACLVYGPQRVLTLAEARRRKSATAPDAIDAADFDARPPGFESEESDVLIHPKPIPEVVRNLVEMLELGDESFSQLSHEFQYVLGTLQYLQERLSSTTSIDAARTCRKLDPPMDASIGCYMNLHCGHNNPFSKDEKAELKELLERALAAHDDCSSLELAVV